jgi:hypothetical protein
MNLTVFIENQKPKSNVDQKLIFDALLLVCLHLRVTDIPCLVFLIVIEPPAKLQEEMDTGILDRQS